GQNNLAAGVIRAWVFQLSVLAAEYGREPVQISRIAEKEKIPRRFLEGILLSLKNIGMLNSTRGKSGGYYLLKDPREVILFDVVICFEGSVSMLACVCEDQYMPCEFCKDEDNCPIRKPFSEIYRHIIDVLRRTTLADLVKEQHVNNDKSKSCMLSE
ncbi:Rrf2 family transcriptional regulator, partial [uncultured Alistipes sp.]